MDSPLTGDETNDSVSRGVTSSPSPETVTDEDSNVSGVVSLSPENVVCNNSVSPDEVNLSSEIVDKDPVSRSPDSLGKTVTPVAVSVVSAWRGSVTGATGFAVPTDRGELPDNISVPPVDFVTSAVKKSPLPEGLNVSDGSVLTVTTLGKSDKPPDPVPSVKSPKLEVSGKVLDAASSVKSPELSVPVVYARGATLEVVKTALLVSPVGTLVQSAPDVSVISEL